MRRDISEVLSSFFVALSRPPEEARQLIGQPPRTTAPNIIEPEAFAQAETLRTDLLALRRDVAVVMANLLIGSGHSPDEAKSIVMDCLKPKNRRKNA